MLSVHIVSNNTLSRIGLLDIFGTGGIDATASRYDARIRRARDGADRVLLLEHVSAPATRAFLSRTDFIAHASPVVVFAPDLAALADLSPRPPCVRGVFSACDDGDRIRGIVTLVHSGNSVFPEALRNAAPASVVESAGLTPRERDVLAVLRLGRTNKEIARSLNIAANTVEVHVASIIRKLNVRNRTEVALVSRRNIDLNDNRQPMGLAG